MSMKRFRWDKTKSEKLKKERNVSFEEIIFAMTEGGLLDVLEHPNKKRYRNQKLFVMRCANYVHLIPFVETEDVIFLKTIIPSRKFTKRYGRSYEK